MAEDVAMRDVEDVEDQPKNSTTTVSNGGDEMDVDLSAVKSENLAKTAEIAKSTELKSSAAMTASLGASSEVIYSDPDPTLSARSQLWRESEKGPIGVGGLGNVASVKSAIASYFPELAAHVSVVEPAARATADSALKEVIENYKFEDLENLFTHDPTTQSQLLGAETHEPEDDGDGKKKGPKKTAYSVRTEDEDLLVMEDRELTLDDIDTTLLITGIDKKRGSKSTENALIAFFRDTHKISPQALGRFNRREDFWKVIFATKSDAIRVVSTTAVLKVGENEFSIQFRRPIMYRIVNNDPTVDIPQAKKDEVHTRVRSLISLETSNEKKRKDAPRDASDSPKKKPRFDSSQPVPAQLSPPLDLKKSASKTIDLTVVKSEPKPKSEAPKLPPPSPTSNVPRVRSERDSGRESLPADIHIIPYNPTGKYFPEDELAISAVKVVLRARRMEEDGSLWLLCGPLTAKVTSESVSDVAWIEAAIIFQRYPLLASKFLSFGMDWSRGEILYETVSD